MNIPISPQPSDALANLAAQAEILPGRYLITGPQAAYIYHRWILPIAKIINIRISEGDMARWQATLAPPWTVFTETPSLTQVRPATRVAILEPYLSEALYQRRVIINGLAFISPEDLCAQLLATAATQIALSEIAALLIAQKDTLNWAYLWKQASASQWGQRLMEIVQAINHEAGRTLLPQVTVGTEIASMSRMTTIHPDTLTDIMRPLQAQWKLANAQPTRD